MSDGIKQRVVATITLGLLASFSFYLGMSWQSRLDYRINEEMIKKLNIEIAKHHDDGQCVKRIILKETKP